MTFTFKKFACPAMVMSVMILICANVFAGEACKQAKDLWKERISADAQLRLKRADLQQKIIDNKIKANEMEKKMARIEMEMLKAPEKNRDALWAEYDLISQQRDELSKEMEPLYKEEAKVSSERSSKKMEFKTKQMEKRYECMVNERLSASLDDIVKKIDENKIFSEKEATSFKELCKLRADIIAYIKNEYQKYKEELNEKTSLYEKSNLMLETTLKDEETYDHEREKYSDEISDVFDKWQKTVDQYSEQISKISEQLLPYTQKPR